MRELAGRLSCGEEAAFVELYDACADRLHRFLVSRLGSREMAADVLQTVMLRAVASRRRFASVENPVGYLFQIARNEAARGAKRRWRWPAPHEFPTEALPQFANDSTRRTDDAEVVAAALARLADDDREIVELKVYGGLTFREVGEATGRPPASVATRYRRALESLRPWLSKQLQD